MLGCLVYFEWATSQVVCVCVCVCGFLFLLGFFLLVLEGGRGHLHWALSTLETDSCWSVMALKMLLPVEIAVTVSPVQTCVCVPSSSVPSVDMALDDIGSNCTLTAANRDNSLETVTQVKLNGSSELYKVQIGIPVVEQLSRGAYEVFGGMHRCGSYCSCFVGDGRNLEYLQECSFSSQ